MGVKSIDAAETKSSHESNILFLVNSQSQFILNLIQMLPV